MKVLVRIFTIALLSLPISAEVYAQVDAFSASITQQESMLVSWTMQSGVTCIDLELQHAGLDLNFNPVYLHNGICGSTEKEESYSFEQFDGVKTTNFYRIKLGFIGYSDTIRTDAPLLGSEGIVISPQPASNSFQFQFSNSKADKFTLSIYNLTGKLVYYNTQIVSNSYVVNSSEIPAGYYVFDLRSNYQSFQGKIGIVH